jgi:hypothetical protein
MLSLRRSSSCSSMMSDRTNSARTLIAP